MIGRHIRLWSGLALLALLAACGGPVGKPRTSIRPAPLSPPSPTLRQCLAKLDGNQVRYSRLPDAQYGGGCSAIDSVKLLDIGVPVSGLGAMTCPLAANFAAWVQYGVRPAARLILKSEVVRIDTFGTYSCRPIAGSGKLSEHGRSNAIDIAAFVLADGRRVSLQSGWRGPDAEQQFLRVVRASACKRFRTVLSPDYNAAHHDHLHFDMGGKGGYCR